MERGNEAEFEKYKLVSLNKSANMAKVFLCLDAEY